MLGPPLSFETPAFIRIPVVGIDEEVREGSDIDEEMYTILSMGPIHLTHTGFPGWPGNCVISGHRTTKTKPFNRLDELKAGDAIYIQNPRGVYEYQVTELQLHRPQRERDPPDRGTCIDPHHLRPRGRCDIALGGAVFSGGFHPG